ncbi:exodeoxyribonuclease VII small subunit [Atopobium deltae]|uniref:exodeoxyribonuclease VII small subunit n=1 Tax=Atopobium deltae TaxID=1393034 RepID=UPI0009ECB86C|nr:exodeoxyribonuclease VII small subunit [Atopobium deltae]
MSASPYQSFNEICDRLDEIVDSVRDKDTSLEHSLDLFEEAIALGSRAVDMVDKPDTITAVDLEKTLPSFEDKSVEKTDEQTKSTGDAPDDKTADPTEATSSDINNSTSAEA